MAGISTEPCRANNPQIRATLTPQDPEARHQREMDQTRSAHIEASEAQAAVTAMATATRAKTNPKNPRLKSLLKRDLPAHFGKKILNSIRPARKMARSIWRVPQAWDSQTLLDLSMFPTSSLHFIFLLRINSQRTFEPGSLTPNYVFQMWIEI
jgi:hypothetical protein